MKEKILKRCNIIPVNNLINYINEGEVTLQELLDAGLTKDKVDALKEVAEKREKEASRAEDECWDSACTNDSQKSYNDYIHRYPGGRYVAEAKKRLQNLDDSYWKTYCTGAALSEQSLENYRRLFPDGKHLPECDDALKDLEWLQVRKSDTIQDYKDYIEANPHSPHVNEASQHINRLSDDNDWNIACQLASTAAYKDYLQQHSHGKYTGEARKRIQMRAGKDLVLDELREDPNAKNAFQIQRDVKNGLYTWEDLMEVFSEGQVDAIQSWANPSALPQSDPPIALQEGPLEVYFWGMPGSGKTCALGALISSLNKDGVLEPQKCKGANYMNRLSNLFVSDGYCVLPDSTSFSNIQEMIMNIRDHRRRLHTISLIDLAGELFRTIYYVQNNLFVEPDDQKTINIVLNYLRNTRNKKVHFFVIPYGDDKQRDKDGLNMDNYLTTMAIFLRDNKILRKSTTGVYLLVTKCDCIPGPPEERPKKAFEYVKKEFRNFYNMMDDNCRKAYIKDFKTVAFSVGDVFAQNLCAFNDGDMEKVKMILLAKSHAKGGWLSNLLND